MSIGEISAQGAEKKEYKPIPDGIYEATVLKVTPGKKAISSDQIYTEVEFVISNGEFEKRHVWERFAEQNASDSALKVSRSRKERLLQATLGEAGAEEVFTGGKDLDIVVGKPLKLDLVTKGKFVNAKRFLRY